MGRPSIWRKGLPYPDSSFVSGEESATLTGSQSVDVLNRVPVYGASRPGSGLLVLKVQVGWFREKFGHFLEGLSPMSFSQETLVCCYCGCSVTQSCPTLCDPRHCSTPGFSVLHCLPEFAQICVLWVGDVVQPSHPLPPPSHPALNLSQHQGLLQWGGSSNHVANILELQLQHQPFQYSRLISFRIDWFDLLAVCSLKSSWGLALICVFAIFSLPQGIFSLTVCKAHVVFCGARCIVSSSDHRRVWFNSSGVCRPKSLCYYSHPGGETQLQKSMLGERLPSPWWR